VDAVNVTDNQGAHVRLSALAGALAVRDAGVEPVMQLTGRDRNRIALQSDLLAAGALAIPNLLLLSGDHPRYGDHPDAAPVFDLSNTELIGVARALRDDGRLMSGRQVSPPPRYLIGAVVDAIGPPEPLQAKIAAGAEFVQTQLVFDQPAFHDWLGRVRDLGLHARCALLAGVGPIRSLRTLEFLRSRVPGVQVPDEVVRRLLGVPPDRVAEEGMRLCVETVQRLRETPGVAGVHLMPAGVEQAVPEIVQRAGLA
jgi:methylenetetrahydrofolate reductase (NADPH)